MAIDVLNQEGKKLSQLELPQPFQGKVNKALIWEYVKMQMATRRSGTASTKTRSNVRGSTRKIYRQKGTGNARHGDIKAPIFAGGGQAFGPLPRDYSYRMPSSSRRQALKSALALKTKEGLVKVVDQFSFGEIKTKKALEYFKNLGLNQALLVVNEKNEKLEKSVRNLAHFKVLRAEGLNVYDILRYNYLVITQDALSKIEGRLV
ncbi:MAG: 50S ribosomal protein L4 [Deltaproteobacteria bacterium]|nr:50S ribosomal protein L4 [Deltaproteobacteria bacterium]